MLEEGGTPEKRQYVDEEIYSANGTVNSLTIDGIDYAVTILAQEDGN